MKRAEIIQYKEQLNIFLHKLRVIIGMSIFISVCMFLISIIFLYNKMLVGSMLMATLAYITFHLLRKYSVSMAKKWVRVGGGQEEMLYFLDKEMNGTTPRDFFCLLERALKVIDEKKLE